MDFRYSKEFLRGFSFKFVFAFLIIILFPGKVLAQFDEPYDSSYGDFSDYVYDSSYGNSSYDSCYGCDFSYDSAYSDFSDYVYDSSYVNSSYDTFYNDVSYDSAYSDFTDYVYDSSYTNSSYDSSYSDSSYDASYGDFTDYVYDSSYGDSSYSDAPYPDAPYPDTSYPDSPYPDSNYTQGGSTQVTQVNPNTFVSNFNAPNSAAVATNILGSGGTVAQATQGVLDYLASIGMSGTVMASSDPSSGWTSIVILCDNDTGGVIINIHEPTLPEGPYVEMSDYTYVDSTDYTYVDTTDYGSYGDFTDYSYSDSSDYGSYDSAYALPVFSDLYIVPKPGANNQIFLGNENTTYTFQVGNIGTSTVSAQVGFWPKGAQGVNNMPTCGDPIPVAGNPVQLQTVNLLGGQIRDVSFTFNVGTTSATAYAYVTYACNAPDNNWTNNSAGVTYQINSATWFEALGGDVGAGLGISEDGVPTSGRYTSQYLLVGNPLTSNTTTQRWRLNNYNQPQVSVPVYQFLNDRFRLKAKTNICSADGLFTGVSTTPVFNYCGGDVNLNTVTNVPGGFNYIWFVDGNLTISQNITVPANSTVVFVVRGNITVGSNVIRADGVYISNRTFSDVSTTNDGPQLRIDGAIYASGIQLPRNCDLTCSNINDPVEIITFQPRYIEALNNILGSPAITWQEVAP